MVKTKNWKKIKDRTNEEVWSNGTYRVVSAKGDKSWVVWYEKNKGKIASDESFISNSYIGVVRTKEEARKIALKYMRL